MKLITDLQYFAPVNWFEISNRCTDIVFEQYEFYQKMSFRNRCQVAGGEGVINLSVPLVKGRDQKTVMKDVRIAGDKGWQATHWKTLISCYSRSPWFEFYKDGLEALYRRRVEFLVDWNLVCYEWICGALGRRPDFSLSEGWQETYDGTEWEDLRGKIVPKDRGGSEGGRGPVRYHQVFEERTGFLPDLSILDLLFCEGKRSRELLEIV
jgi:hypothetical protein